MTRQFIPPVARHAVESRWAHASRPAPRHPRGHAGQPGTPSISPHQPRDVNGGPSDLDPPASQTKAAQRPRGDSPGQSDLQEGWTEGVRFALGTKFHAHLFMEQIAASLKCHTFQAVGWALWAALGSAGQPTEGPRAPWTLLLHTAGCGAAAVFR